MRLDGTADTPVGTREVRFTDPRFIDTAGGSYAVMPRGNAVCLQTTAVNLGCYVRVSSTTSP